MRRTLMGLIAAAALGSMTPAAFAADMAVPEPAPVMSWTGFYLGAGGGAAWADLDLNHRLCEFDENGVCFEGSDFHRDFNDSSDVGGVGIVQGGFDYELAPSFVVGVGADATFGDVLGDVNGNRHHDEIFGFDHNFDNDGSFLVDVYGRAGFAPTENFLIFGLVGWTWADIDTDFRMRDENGDTLFHNSDTFNANGISFGGGVEWKWTDSVSLRAEYRFTDLDNFDNNGHFDGDFDWCEGDCHFRHRNDVDINVQRVLFTINWRFGGFGAATAAAY
jgi:outer membrane immunogenic protein